MVDPNLIRSIKSDRITTPDVLRVQLSDVDVLNNDIADTVLQSQTLAPNDTLAAHTDDGLVGRHIDALNGSLVVCASGSGITTAPVGVVDRVLAATTAGVGGGNAALAVGTLALGAKVVELFVDQNNSRGAIGQPRGQLGSIARGSSNCVATTSGASCKSERGSGHACGLDSCAEQHGGCQQRSIERHDKMKMFVTEPAV